MRLCKRCLEVWLCANVLLGSLRADTCRAQARKNFWRGIVWSKKGQIQRYGWWMRWWWHFDRGNFDLTGPRLSHESKCVSQALEMEGRSLWLWHPCEGLRLLGVKCDTSLGRCWFSVATAQQTSSHGVSRGVWVRGWGAPSTGQRMEAYCSSSARPSCDSLQIMYLRPTHRPTPSLIFTVSLFLSMHFFNHKGAMCNCFGEV